MRQKYKPILSIKVKYVGNCCNVQNNLFPHYPQIILQAEIDNKRYDAE